MKWIPHYERTEEVTILAKDMSVDLKSAYPDWGSRLIRHTFFAAYDYVVAPTMEEAMLPEELR